MDFFFCYFFLISLSLVFTPTARVTSDLGQLLLFMKRARLLRGFLTVIFIIALRAVFFVPSPVSVHTPIRTRGLDPKTVSYRATGNGFWITSRTRASAPQCFLFNVFISLNTVVAITTITTRIRMHTHAHVIAGIGLNGNLFIKYCTSIQRLLCTTKYRILQ